MNKLEARAIIEATNDYSEDGVDEIMNIYESLAKHIGFEDKRHDNRFIVKFHDIFYYMPEKLEEDYEEIMNALFDDFCNMEYEYIKDDLETNHIDTDYMLTKYDVGHYPAFIIDIPEITDKNITDLAMEIYDEYGWEGINYVENYIHTVNLLQDLEDNYMDYWIEFLEGTDIPEKYIKEIKKKYKEDMERRKAIENFSKVI